MNVKNLDWVPSEDPWNPEWASGEEKKVKRYHPSSRT